MQIFLSACREPLGEIQFEKNWWDKKGEGGKIFIEPLGGVVIS
jgi:hypothetical protein